MEVSAMEKALPEARKKGGLRTIPFIISNEIFEKVATFGLGANMVVYLMQRYRMTAATATMELYMWAALSNFLCIFGGVLSDARLGRFRVIAIGSCVSLSGMCLLLLTAILPAYKNTPECAARPAECVLVLWQLPLLFASFLLMSIGSAGIRPCAMAFGADQLDKRDNSAGNVRRLQTFFNWYYTVLGLSIVFASTVIVYLQDHKGWVVGFSVPVVLMVTALALFLVGAPFYLRAEADSSVIVTVAQVLAASYRNRCEPFPPEKTAGASLFHNGAGGKEPSPDDPWALCTVQQVEDVKATVRVLPIWSTAIIPGVIVGQQMFPVLQAKLMDCRVGRFDVPAASFGTANIVALTVWVAFYDRALVGPLSRLTGHARGLSMRQRMGLGLALFAAAMGVAAWTESARRAAPVGSMSALRLLPQHCLAGLAEALNLIGQIEFYYSEFPKTMSSIGVSLLMLAMSIGALLGAAIVGIISKCSGWLPSNLNEGHYDYYYLLLALLAVANFAYFLWCAWAYGDEGQNRVMAVAEDAEEEKNRVMAVDDEDAEEEQQKS